MELLDRKDYVKATSALSKMTINNLFARSVLEGKITGKVYADNKLSPTTFYILHPYGMSLLLGNSSNHQFNEQFKNHALNTGKNRQRYEWMQVFPDSWNPVLATLLGDQLVKLEDNEEDLQAGIVELNNRVNFKFNKEKFLLTKLIQPAGNEDIAIVQTDAVLFREMKGSVTPADFWDSEQDFLKNGFAYSLLYQGKLAATAFSACWFGELFELGIETNPEFRGQGFARLVCTKLIEFCIQQGYEPLWACRQANTGSYQLALKLGFDVSSITPYYRLSK
ncbi:GNAT family N-acetyltransferase [Chitinophaga sp.]|uniref:GNAT family N-acetyltransferase n=1 Tax=Chitinophaga sp. TaxID=1869181 RepID=UPI0031D67D69